MLTVSWRPCNSLPLNISTALLASSGLNAEAYPQSSTLIRALYNDDSLFIRFDAPFTELTQFEPARFDSERAGLWDRDVVEAFIQADAQNAKVYHEFEVAPTGEKLDLVIDPEVQDIQQRLAWNSGWETFVELDPKTKPWTTVMRIPLKALSSTTPVAGERWRANFFRIERAQRAFLAWNPTLKRTFHAPERFGWIEFGRD